MASVVLFQHLLLFQVYVLMYNTNKHKCIDIDRHLIIIKTRIDESAHEA